MPVEVSVYRRRRQVARFNTRTSGYVSMTAKRRVLLSVPPLEPIPETVEAVNELDPSVEDGDLLADLTELANHAQEIVPDLVGVSVARMAEGAHLHLGRNRGRGCRLGRDSAHRRGSVR
jgi:hypothetical protein